MLKKLFRKLRKNQSEGFRSSWVWEGNFTNLSAFTTTIGIDSGPKPPVDKRKQVKPKDVMEELFTKKPNIDFSNLGEKIKAIKKRRDFMKDDLGVNASEENQALRWLQARKKGLKIVSEFKWPITTVEKIEALLKKYKLKRAPIQQYSLALPSEAIDEMEKYVKLHKKVTQANPDFIILADEVEEKTKRRDPILLAVSPFGQYFHILGAWDKEVAILHELFFKNE